MGTDPTPEAEYRDAVVARDLTRAGRALCRANLVLPLYGAARQLAPITYVGGQYVEAFTSAELLERIRGDSATGRRENRFVDLVTYWRPSDIGLVVDLGSPAALAIPAASMVATLLDFERARVAAAVAPWPQGVQPARYERDGFRLATEVDGYADDGRPMLAPSRGRVDEMVERRNLLSYLDGGAPVLGGLQYASDPFDPGAERSVPVGWRTDGRWVWSDGTRYFLANHGIAPEPEFRISIGARGGTCPPVAAARVTAAGAALAASRQPPR